MAKTTDYNKIAVDCVILLYSQAIDIIIAVHCGLIHLATLPN